MRSNLIDGGFLAVLTHDPPDDFRVQPRADLAAGDAFRERLMRGVAARGEVVSWLLPGEFRDAPQ